jgi:hypothetical protein
MTEWDWGWTLSCLIMGSTGFIVLPMVITEGRLAEELLARWRAWRAR